MANGAPRLQAWAGLIKDIPDTTERRLMELVVNELDAIHATAERHHRELEEDIERRFGEVNKRFDKVDRRQFFILSTLVAVLIALLGVIGVVAGS